MWFAAVGAAGFLLWRLAPVLTPFVVASLLAYLGDPLVDRLEEKRLSRTLSVVVVFSFMLVAGLIALLILLPLLSRQIMVLIERIPVAINWLQHDLLPMIATLPGAEGFSIDAEKVRDAIASHWQEFGAAISSVLLDLLQSGQVLVGWFAFLVLVPVVTFYLLRDWDIMVKNIHDLLPRSIEGRVEQLARECDAVLAEFMRGQFLVMIALAIVYSLGLWVVGLDVAFLVGMLSGFVSFVPYLGFIVGIVAASIAALMQFQDVIHLIYVVIVFGFGQMLEGMFLSPVLVGDRIGLHPVAVIFAVMAGGQLFGFFGVLMALPVAAVIVVLLRHGRDEYLQSSLYTPKK